MGSTSTPKPRPLAREAGRLLPLFFRHLWGDLKLAFKWRLENLQTRIESWRLRIDLTLGLVLLAVMVALSSLAPLIAGLIAATLLGGREAVGAAAGATGGIAGIASVLLLIWVAGR